MRQIITYDEIKTTRTVRWKEDGKNKQKTESFTQTINPWNKNKDGQLKSREEILQEINEEADLWVVEFKSSLKKAADGGMK